MNTIRTAAAAVIGARHGRAARNGQDATAIWRGDRDSDGHRACDAAVVVVCDGCSSGEASEVGARLGAKLFASAVGTRLLRRASPADPVLWADARAELVAALCRLAGQLAGPEADELDAVVRDHFLFTIVAAAVRGDEAAVWALGDGVYSLGDTTRELGPFPDNAPPYLGYDLFGDTRAAHLEVVPAGTRSIIIATDGAADLLATGASLVRFASPRFLDHPDALRRELSVLARPQERIDWDERRVVRTPAVLQDDCAIGVLRWEVPS